MKETANCAACGFPVLVRKFGKVSCPACAVRLEAVPVNPPILVPLILIGGLLALVIGGKR